MVIDDLAHCAGRDVSAGAGHGVDLRLHGWGGGCLAAWDGGMFGEDRDLDAALQRGGVEVCHVRHVDEVDG